jgi:thiamine biosynthesis lipoprotein
VCTKSLKPATALLVVLLAHAGVSRGSERFRASEPHMGSITTITLYADNADQAQQAFVRAFARVAELDSILSDYDSKSELSRFCESGKTPGKDLAAVVDFAQALSAQTEGAFDLSAGTITHLWRAARQQKRIPAPAEIQAALERSGYRKLHGNTCGVPGMQLDAGGIAKGYAADEALSVLKTMGIASALVALSGDISIGEPPPGQPGWKVKLGDQILKLRNCGVSTSGDEFQGININGIRYSHIVDPRTGWALRNSVPVSVTAKTAMEADAIATAVSVGGAETARILKSKRDVQIFLQD